MRTSDCGPQAARRVLAGGVIAGLVAALAATTTVGASSLGGSRRPGGMTPLAQSVAGLAGTTDATALRTQARAALADPLALGTTDAKPALTATPPVDPRLAAFTAPFAQSVVALERAALTAQQLASTAFTSLTPRQRATVVAHAARVLHDGTDAGNRLRDATATHDRAAIERARDDVASALKPLGDPGYTALLSRADTSALTQAAQLVTQAAQAVRPALDAYAHESRSGDSFTGSCSRPGPLYCDDNNLVEVWGVEDDTYTTDSVAMIRIDLGGNDTYNDHTAYALGDASNCNLDAPSAGCATALVLRANLDVAGNDTYSVESLGQAVGVLGVGVLVDGAGKDSYGCLAVCQGIGLAGAGVVADLGNDDDTYGSLAMAQGVGVIGAGAVIDAGGNDSYFSLAIGQGVGVVGGGVLADGTGNDTYRCLAVCQGTALVGAGLLIDGAGNDSYSGFEIFGLRIPGVVTLATNIGGGASAVIDLLGDDTYETIDYGLAVAQSANIATTLTQTKQTDTWALVFDGAGTDSYWASGPTTFGIATGYSYARFRDAGALPDTYTSTNPNPRNNGTWVQSDGYSTWLAGYDMGEPNGMGRDD